MMLMTNEATKIRDLLGLFRVTKDDVICQALLSYVDKLTVPLEIEIKTQQIADNAYANLLQEIEILHGRIDKLEAHRYKIVRIDDE